jgi:hypothetical protein
MKYFRLNPRTRFVAALFALALVAGFAAMTFSPRPGVVSANDGRDHRNADVTFTKWIVDPDWLVPLFDTQIDMQGVVTGGDAGSTGTFTGEAFLRSPGILDAFYHVNGEHHSFTADVHIDHGVITGVVTEGWLKGSPVTGGFVVQAPCDVPTPGNVFGNPGKCFPVTLHIDRGSKD